MELPTEICECAFHLKTDICSSESIINRMKEYILHNLANLNEKKVTAPGEIIKIIKTMTGCKSESCVLKDNNFANFIGHDKIKKELDERFKPHGPALTYDLLSNFNIDDVLDQLEKAYKSENFYHVPFQMRDFETYKKNDNEIAISCARNAKCMKYEKDQNLATIDLAEKYTNGMRCFGVVFNTDYSTGNGIHWFCIFGDFRKKPYTIEYFNSSGNLPLIEISSWMKNTKTKLAKQLNTAVVDVISSRIEHQFGDNQCGIYSLYYILSRLENVPYTYFSNNRIPDELMDDFRKMFFRLEN